MGIDSKTLLKYKLAYKHGSVEVSDIGNWITFTIEPTGKYTSIKIPCISSDYTYKIEVTSCSYRYDNLVIEFAEGITKVEFGDLSTFLDVSISIPKTATLVGSSKNSILQHLTIDFNDAHADVDWNSQSPTPAKVTEFKGYEHINCSYSGTTFLLNQRIVAPNVPHLNLNELGYRPFKLVVPHAVETIEMGIKDSITARYYKDSLYHYVDKKTLNKYLDFIVENLNGITMEKVNKYLFYSLVGKMKVVDVGVIYVEDPSITKFVDKVEGVVIVVPKGMSDYVSSKYVSRKVNRVVEV